MTISIEGLTRTPESHRTVMENFRRAVTSVANGTMFKVNTECVTHLFMKTGSNTLFEMQSKKMFKIRHLSGTMSLHSNDHKRKKVNMLSFSVVKGKLILEE